MSQPSALPSIYKPIFQHPNPHHTMSKAITKKFNHTLHIHIMKDSNFDHPFVMAMMQTNTNSKRSDTPQKNYNWDLFSKILESNPPTLPDNYATDDIENYCKETIYQ